MKKKTAQLPWFREQLIPVLLAVVIMLGGLLRMYQLALLPATLNRDEAALAYNALLLKETGKDEWGKSWPVALESFGDYKLPGYPLLIIGMFSIFGVNDFAVRVPSALAGTALIAIGYFFARKVLRLQQVASLFVAVTIALQPIFFFYSRMAWEANVALAFFVSSVTLLLAVQDGQRGWRSDCVAIICALIAVCTYNTPLLLLPFLMIAVVMMRGVKKIKSWRLPVLLLLIIFVGGFVTFSSISQQKSGITIFSDETTWLNSVEYRQSFTGLAQRVVGNRYVFFAKIMAQHFIDSFSPSFVLQRGGQHPWHNLPNHGHMLGISYVLAMAAVVRLIWIAVAKKSTSQLRRTALTLLLLLVTSLAPSVITVDSPHATRSLFFFFLLSTFAGVGFEWWWNAVATLRAQKKLYEAAVVFVLLFTVTQQSIQYYTAYFTRYPKQSAVILKAGLGEQVRKMEQDLHGRSEQVAIVDPDGFLYISVAWELKMTPAQFSQTVTHHLPDRIGLKYGYRVGRYRFIAQPEDMLPEDKYIIAWNPDINRWETK